MKHRTSCELFRYWDSKRSGAPMPDSTRHDPRELRSIAADTFMLTADPSHGFLVRAAGTRVIALLGGNPTDQSFHGLFRGQEIAETLSVLTDDSKPVCAGIAGRSHNGGVVRLELLLLPLRNSPLRIIGSLAPFSEIAGYAAADLHVTSWRVVQVQNTPMRDVRRRPVGGGLTAYEGLLRAS